MYQVLSLALSHFIGIWLRTRRYKTVTVVVVTLLEAVTKSAASIRAASWLQRVRIRASSSSYWPASPGPLRRLSCLIVASAFTRRFHAIALRSFLPRNRVSRTLIRNLIGCPLKHRSQLRQGWGDAFPLYYVGIPYAVQHRPPVLLRKYQVSIKI